MTFVLDIRTATPHFPGIGRYLAGLTPALAAQLAPDERLLLLGADTAQAAQFEHLLTPDARVSICYVPASPFSLSQQWQVPQALRKVAASGEPLVYHSPYYLMSYRPAAPTVLTVYDLIPILLPDAATARARLLFRLTHRLAWRAARQIIAISATTANDLATIFGVDRRHITVIPLGVDAHFHPQPLSERERVRSVYGLPISFLLYVGINKPHKNLVNLLEAYAQLSSQTPPLVIAGAWDRRYPEAMQAANRLQLADRVRFLGPAPESDLPGLYSAATLFVFPSRYEGFGLPVLEAMACGTPVACSSASSLPEVAEDAALYFDPMQPASIAQTLQSLLDDDALRCRLAGKGEQRARQFTWARTASATLAVYRKAVS